jgi:hypothetical protein
MLKTNSNRLRILKIHPLFLGVYFTTGRQFVTTAGIPDGARILSAHVERQTGLIWLYVWHECFEEVPLGTVIPTLEPVTVETRV